MILLWETDHEVGVGRALEIRDELSASELRALAAREKKNRAARRMLAIANALEGMSRASAARAAGMDRQALRDAVVRYNAEGLDGLYDRPTPGRPPVLTEAELALLSARIFRGPDPETDGVSSWTLPDLCVSGGWRARLFQLDGMKFHGSRSSMRFWGCPAAMASSVALR